MPLLRALLMLLPSPYVIAYSRWLLMPRYDIIDDYVNVKAMRAQMTLLDALMLFR